MTDDPYPNLRYLLAGYLHEDWDLDGPTPRDVLVKAIKESPPRIREGICVEIRAVIHSDRTDRELSSLLRELGASFEPSLIGQSTKHWLTEVLEVAGC